MGNNTGSLLRGVSGALFIFLLLPGNNTFAGCYAVNASNHDSYLQGNECTITSGKLFTGNISNHRNGETFNGNSSYATISGVTTITRNGTISSAEINSGSVSAVTKRDSSGVIVEAAELLSTNNGQERIAPDAVFMGTKERYIGKDGTGATLAVGDVKEIRNGYVNGPMIVNVTISSNLLFSSSGTIKSGTVIYAGSNGGYWKMAGKKFAGTLTITYSNGTPTVNDSRVQIP